MRNKPTVPATTIASPLARGDTVAYLVNVTVRPGYHFADAGQAVAYGLHICQRLRAGDGYEMVAADIKSDFATADEYHAAYLITQAVNELCPALIFQLRKSAAAS